jgi:alpha-L-fucosidase
MCLLLASLVLTTWPATVTAAETGAERDARMRWWREARFGMFIHWGLYAIPGGEWNGKRVGSGGEWILNTAHIPLADYEKLRERFNPTKFDARAWVRTAHDAGMRYLVVTSKHHDGFCLWPSKVAGDWSVAGTPFKRDVLRELADAIVNDHVRLKRPAQLIKRFAFLIVPLLNPVAVEPHDSDRAVVR